LVLSTAIDLSGSTNPKLVFWHKYDLEDGWDYGRVEVSEDGGSTWTQLQSYTGVSGWTREQLDLSSHKSGDVKIRFRLQTDDSVTRDGWYIDDTAVSELPEQVTGLTVTQSVTEPATALDLSWNQTGETDFAFYRIYRSAVAGVSTDSTEVIDKTDIADTTYTDSLLSPETTYYYRVYVYNLYDLAVSGEEASAITAEAAFGYPFFDDMEGSVSAWTPVSPWDVVTPVAEGDNWMGSGESKVWSSSPSGLYESDADTSLQLTIDLGTADMPVLSFWHRHSFDTSDDDANAQRQNLDYGFIEAREVGGTSWRKLYFVTGVSDGWVQEYVDLSIYKGKNVDLRFRVDANGDNQRSSGWLIDEVRIDETAAVAVTYPFNDDLEQEDPTVPNWYSSSWGLVAGGHDNSANTFTDSPASWYARDVYSSLIMANSIDLSGSTHPILTFWYKHSFYRHTNYEEDRGEVWVSTNNGHPGSWELLRDFRGSQADWAYVQIDLSGKRASNVRVKFEIHDTVYSSNENDGGWYIDDIKIEEAPTRVDDLTITATAQNAVTLTWAQNGDPDFERYEIYRSSSPNQSRSGTPVATLSPATEMTHTDNMAMIQPGVYYYRMWVIDQDNNISKASNEVQASYTVPSNDFPFTEDGGGTGQWSWGTPWGLKTMAGHSDGDTSVWADSPEGSYDPNANTSLATYIDLSGTTHPVLSFWHHYSLEENADYIYLEVSTDNGETWTPLGTYTGTENLWNQERVNLTTYAGHANLGLRFRLESNSANEQDGWHMDDLTIAEGEVAAAYPFSDGFESGEAPWFYQSPWGLKQIPAEDSRNNAETNVWVSSPAGVYKADANSWLKVRIDLGSASMPVLSFWHKHSFDTTDDDTNAQRQNLDYGFVEVQEVGGTSWRKLYFVTGVSDGWVDEYVDLSIYKGKNIDIRFRVDANSDNQRSNGWLIDDVRIGETEAEALTFPLSDDLEQEDPAAPKWYSSSWGLVTGGHNNSANAFTDSPTSWYARDVYSSLIMANSIDLSGSTHPILTFWYKHAFYRHTNYEEDRGEVWVSTNNGQPGSWELLRDFRGDQSDWAYVQIDLSGKRVSNVRIKFQIHDTVYSSNENSSGWYIDDIRIEEAPTRVDDLAVTATSQNAVTLTWGQNEDGDFERYEIYRSSSPSQSRSGTPVATLSPATETTHTDNMAMVQPGVYYYRMWVIDQDDNVSMASNEVQASYTVPSNDFPFTEDGAGTGQWSWGTPWGLKTMAGRSDEDTSVWADSPEGSYGPNANTSLATYIDLSGTTHPVLSFWHHYSLEENADYIYLEVSTDNGENWSELGAFTGTENLWNQERVNLTTYAGHANLGLRFRLESNGANEQDGWHMDDLTIAEGPVAAVYPFYDDVESGKAPWFYQSPWGLKQITAEDSRNNAETNVWVSSPAGIYKADANSWLKVRIDLGSANMPVLSFWHKHSFDTTDDDTNAQRQNLDYGFVEAKEVGGTSWRKLYFTTGVSDGWVQEYVDLSIYKGKNVDVRFRVDANSDNQRSNGWLIDEIAIDETPVSVLAPSYPLVDGVELASVADWHTSSWGFTADSHSGTHAFTDSPASWYARDVFSSLIMAKSIDLSGAAHPILTFWHKHAFYQHTNYEEDAGEVWISTNNGQPGSWTKIGDFRGTQSTYYESQIDLADYVGLRNIRIKFEIHDRVYSSNENAAGWTIDQIRIGEDTTIPSYIMTVSGDDQIGQTGTPVAEALVAKVYDSSNSQPKAGILVDFSIESGNGSLSSASGTSDASGLVSVILTLGDAGTNTLRATIHDATESVTFTATGYAVGQAMALTEVSGSDQVNTVGLSLVDSLVVKVTDILGDPVEDADVTFSIHSPAGTGTLGTTEAVATGADGHASNTLTLGASTGTTVVAVSVSGLAPVTFMAHAVLPGGTLGDDDGDGVPNAWEDRHDLDSQDASDGILDADDDGLSNYQEYARGTDPHVWDSDDDGMADGWEAKYGLDPLDYTDAAEDSNDDGQTNLAEYETDGIPIYGRHFQVAGVSGEWVDFYGGVTVGGVGADIHDEVGVLDGDNVVCGKYTVDVPGEYGFMHVYRDDPLTTGVDEGAGPGEELTFRIWDVSEGVEVDVSPDVVTGDDPPAWTSDGDISIVNLAGEGKQTIPLHEGWNLISFTAKTCYYADGVLSHADGPPTEPMLSGTVYLEVESMADVFSSIEGSYEFVRSFDGGGPHSFDPASPEESNLKYVAGGYGYWIKMKEAGGLKVNGMRALPSDALQLRAGWNLVGYWHTDVAYTDAVPLVDFPPEVAGRFTEVDSIDDVLAAQTGNYDVIRSYDANGAHTYDPLLGSFNDLDYLGPGYGIWIKIKSLETQDALSY